MGKNKDAAIGFIGIVVIIAIIVGAVVALVPSELEEKPDFQKIREQQWIEYDKEFEAKQQAELDKQKEEAKLSAEDLQTIIAGFETYNKSVKILLDICGNVETETDFHLLGQLIVESGDEFIDNTVSFGAVRDKLMAEGYGEHPVLGPLMNRSVMLVDLMSACMEILAWEFSG